MRNIQALCADLLAIQLALSEDTLEPLPQMVEAYHLHLNAWLTDTSRAEIEPLQQLRDLHWQTLAQLQHQQRHQRALMQAERQSERVTRAYLSSTPA